MLLGIILSKIDVRERDLFSLIQTKLQPPRVSSGLVERPILINRLNEGLDRKLTLVVAPAGFGKTTLVADWLKQLERPLAWLALDRSENDLSLFLSYIVAAIQSCFPDSCANISKLLQSAELAAKNRLLATLLNDLFALPDSFLLVLDDYHLIQEMEIQQFMGSLLERMPKAMHLVLVSRADPLLPLSRLRVEKLLVEIRTDSLRFSDEEAWQVLQLGNIYAVETTTAAILNQRVEGWAAGLQLAALSYSETSHEQWMEDFQQRPNEFIVDYLFAEVLSHQPPTIQRFLVSTSILDRFSVDLCQALLEDENSSITSQRIRAIIAELRRMHLFIIALDEQNGWYRYHHLFQQMLQQKLTMENSKAEVDALHGRAATWLAKEGYTAEALEHALIANYIEEAVAIVEENSRNFLNGLERRTMERWMASLPAEVVWNRPKLLVTKAWLFYRHWHLNALKDLLDRLEELFVEKENILNQDERRFVRGQLHVLRAVTSFQIDGDFGQTIVHSERAVQLLPSSEGGALGTAILHRALALVGLGENKVAADYLQEIIQDPSPIGPAKAQVYIGLSIVHYLAGEFIQMERSARQSLEIIGETLPTRVSAHWLIGMLKYDQNKLDEAETNLKVMVDHRHIGNYIGGFFSWLGMIRILQIRGFLTEAQEQIDGLRADCVRLNQRSFLQMLEVLQTYQRFLEGDNAFARRWTLAYQPELKMDFLFIIDTADLIWCRVLLAVGTDVQYEKVLHYLQGCLALLKNTAFKRRKIQVLAHMAVAHSMLDHDETAQECLREALLLAQPGGIVRSFADAGPVLKSHLQVCQNEGVAEELVGQIMVAMGDVSPTPSMAEATLLTRRELEILQLMQEGLSNKDVASTLNISMHTVKRHASNIYEKLKVNGRQEAIFRAREMGILQ